MSEYYFTNMGCFNLFIPGENVDCQHSVVQNQLVGCSTPTAVTPQSSGPTVETPQGSGSTVQTSRTFMDPPSEPTPCKICRNSPPRLE
ncbi:hypothetical protein TSUD_143040 [Trifolium subterraneum]|uniref:Uncharacterized protein n=1 Tax=Trifolium subterraneum TaxID=3900 RepID=A0A2Z6PFS9_TRISU|nr:hypothetical protein TSUD_143040 [Trifolium subterraneum]